MSDSDDFNEPGPSKQADDFEPFDPSYLAMRPLKILRSLADEYEIVKEVGKGTFGNVYKCLTGENTIVAVKVLRSSRTQSYTDSGFKKKAWFKAEKEFEICHLFKGIDNIVQVLDIFLHFCYPCLVFEYLDDSLLHIIHRDGPMPLRTARPLMEQLLSALCSLKDRDLIHGDLKPENIMIKNLDNSQRQLKVIDFGGAMHSSDCTDLTIFQTLHFRAPEVIICAPRSFKVDMWSAGCIFAEMLAARRLYPGNIPEEQLYMIEKCQGPIPDHVLVKGFNTSRLYRRTITNEYQLHGDEYYKRRRTDALDPYFTFQTDTLFEIIGFDESVTPEEQVLALSLLELMLHLDECWRCSPEEGLCHQFFETEETLQ